MPNLKPPLPPDLLRFARGLRQGQTTAEDLLWALLRNRRLFHVKFRRQHPVKPYVLDFYCEAVKLGIELDGGQHNSAEGRAHDKARAQALADIGIEVLRFWNNEVLGDTEAVLNGIWRALYDRGAAVPSPYGGEPLGGVRAVGGLPSPPAPLPGGEGSIGEIPSRS